MAKLLNTTFLVTQSAPATPSSGFGTLFASSSKIYYKNSNGNTYDLTINGSSSYSVYTTSGTYVYNVASNIKYIKVVCIGGGGGGGTGRRDVAGVNRNGGAGGAGGNINIVHYTSESLVPGTYTITVGAGGAGGLPNAVTGTGPVGQPGGASSFSSSAAFNFVRAPGGPGGGGGGSGTTVANGGTNLYPATGSTGTFNPYSLYYFAGCDGGSATLGAPIVVRGTALGGARWLAAGGAGGGLNTSNVATPGGSGSAIYSYATLIQSGSPGSTEGTSGNNGAPVIDIACLLFASGSGITTGVKIGTGGHGGAVGNGTLSSGAGGSGSLGAGGGGGGGCLATTGLIASSGGKGGDGCVLIFEYY